MTLRYRYNAETCRYEPLVVSRLFARQNFPVLSNFLFAGLGGLVYYNSHTRCLTKIQKQGENAKLKTEWLGIPLT